MNTIPTRRSGPQPGSEEPVNQPAIILVEPQLGENIGTAARAMANFGLGDLRLVAPRDGWPNEKARAAASRADHVIDRAKVFASLDEAVADLGFVYATTARSREVAKPVVGPATAAGTLAALAAAGTASGILFGRERWGLTNDEVARADQIVTLPVDPNFASLNIAQAVLILAYEWRRQAVGEALPFAMPEAEPAPKEDVARLMDHLERALDAVGYFRPPERKPVMVRNLYNIFQNASFSEQEVRTLRGVLAALEVGPLTPEEIAARRRARAAPGAPPPAEDEKAESER